jgi:predicted transcriptional regulator
MSGRVTPEMYNPAGSVSISTLNMLMSLACAMSLRHKNHNIFADNFTVFYMRPVQIDGTINIQARVIGAARNFAKVEVEMFDGDGDMYAKGMLSAQIMKNK